MTYNFDIFKYLFSVVLILSLASCSKPEESKPEALRTVIVYMAADNDLYNNAISNINDMEAGMGNFNGRLIVYLDPPEHAERSEPYILEIRHDNSRTINSPTVKSYSEHNSASATVMEQVIRDIIKMYPAESYGLVLWSHGTGWLPEGAYGSLIRSLSHSAAPAVKTFARDSYSGDEMEIRNIAAHLPVKFDFILFDVCLMAGVEVAYELRNSADYIIASAAEVLADGFPYEKTVPCLFGNEAKLVEAAQNYMNHYGSKVGAYRSATISVTKTGELENLYEKVRGLVRHKVSERNALDKTGVQKYDRLSKTVFFDLEDFVEQLCLGEDLSSFQNQLAKTVIYKGHTPSFVNEYNITRSCGLSCYIPSASAAHDVAYALLEWSNIWQ
ncbi:MAG: hypothetical protein LBC98_00080 [Prevotellaceae bacterium]|jgi:hypothetical protein|nr:hypothetical protein [Prevotellaceae bacterium]